MFNGLLKIPMQFVILFVGILVFVFYQFNAPPAHFNRSNVEAIKGTKYEAKYVELESQLNWIFQERKEAIRTMVQAERSGDDGAVELSRTLVLSLQEEDKKIREEIRQLIKTNDTEANVKDTDYVFISYVLQYMPIGVVGLLLAMIFSAAWSSTSSELNALSTTVVVDIYRRVFVKDAGDMHYLRMSKWFTVMWGGVALAFAILAQQFENLIQAVNIIGSLFYGVILGVFLTAFFLKRVGGRAVFLAAILSEILVIGIFLANEYQWQWVVMGKVIQIRIAYLWLNLIGCGLVMLLAAGAQRVFKSPSAA